MSVPSMSRNTAFTKIVLLVGLGSPLRAEKCRRERPHALMGGVLAVFPRPSAFARARLRERCAAGDPQDLAADVARLLGGQKDVGWRQLGRLGRAPDGGLRRAELRDRSAGHGGR